MLEWGWKRGALMHSEEIGCEVWLPPMLFLRGWPIDCCVCCCFLRSPSSLVMAAAFLCLALAGNYSGAVWDFNSSRASSDTFRLISLFFFSFFSLFLNGHCFRVSALQLPEITCQSAPNLFSFCFCWVSICGALCCVFQASVIILFFFFTVKVPVWSLYASSLQAQENQHTINCTAMQWCIPHLLLAALSKVSPWRVQSWNNLNSA